jgi:hypothetical protein
MGINLVHTIDYVGLQPYFDLFLEKILFFLSVEWIRQIAKN